MNRSDQAITAAAAAPAPEKPVTAHDRNDFRGVMGLFATGVTVVSAGADAPHGMTANSFTSVSLEPPLILICVARTAAMHSKITEAGAFAVSMLSAHQEDVARHFANRHRPHDQHEFDIVDWFPGPNTGAPIIKGTLAWLECRLAAVYDGGDHSIFLGDVLDIGRGDRRDPLLFHTGKFNLLDSTHA